jgi:hypothetical protein
MGILHLFCSARPVAVRRLDITPRTVDEGEQRPTAAQADVNDLQRAVVALSS